jgi:hypothetical protein
MVPQQQAVKNAVRKAVSSGRIAGQRVVRTCAAHLSVWSDVRAFPALAVWSGVICVALMLLGRRILAPRSLQLSGLQLASTATVVAGLAIVVRGLLSRVETARPSARLRLIGALTAMWPTLILLVGTSRVLSLAIQSWIVAMAAGSAWIVWAWNGSFADRLLMTLFGSPAMRKAPARSARESVPAVVAMDVPVLENSRSESAKPECSSEPLFRLERSVREDGTEVVRGTLQVEFLPGQSLVTTHVAFSPAFPKSPAFTCEVVDAPAVRVKGTTVYPYGARIELKAGVDRPGDGLVQVRFRAELGRQVRRSA